MVDKIRKVIKLFFAILFEIIKYVFYIFDFLLNNSIGFLFNKKIIKFKNKDFKNYNNWILPRKIIYFIIIIFIIFSFQQIYMFLFFDLFVFIFKSFGKLLLFLYNKNIKISLLNDLANILDKYSTTFVNGIKYTVYLSLVGTVIGLFIALLFAYLVTQEITKRDNALTKVFKHLTIKFVRLYVTLIRGTPMILQAMVFYYGLKPVIGWAPIPAALFTVAVNTTAYLTEVLRGGINSIDKGQTEGSISLGLSKWKTMLNVIFPQALKNSLPAIGNEFVVNIKDTSVLNVILVEEVFRAVELTGDVNRTKSAIIAAIIYLILTYSIGKIIRKFERKLDLPELSVPKSD